MEEINKKLSSVTRLELINHTIANEKIGRLFVSYDINSVELDFQDDGRTLKIFI